MVELAFVGMGLFGIGIIVAVIQIVGFVVAEKFVQNR